MIKWWRHFNRMGGKKTNKNFEEDYCMESHRKEIQMTSKYIWRDEVFNGLNKLKFKN